MPSIISHNGIEEFMVQSSLYETPTVIFEIGITTKKIAKKNKTMIFLAFPKKN